MKKLLLILPVGLLAATGFFWMNMNQTTSATQNSTTTAPKSSQELFSDSERLLRQIMRHGDTHSIQAIDDSLKKISSELEKRKKEGFAVDKIETMLAEYKKESLFINDKFTPYMNDLHRYSQFEQAHEQAFVESIEQIGLYELKSAYQDLEKLRVSYIKEPTEESRQAYENKAKTIKQIISELYLDSAIESPLFAYLDNHALYFTTLSRAYGVVGYERIYAIRNNSYAIKTELQLLPTI